MPNFKIKLNYKRKIADGTMAFYFEKPMGFAYTDSTAPKSPAPASWSTTRTAPLSAAKLSKANRSDNLRIRLRTGPKRTYGALRYPCAGVRR